MINFLTQIGEMFNEEPDIGKMGFLTSFFKVHPNSFTDSEFLDYDIVKSGAEAAPSVRSLDTGAVTVVEDAFVNKQLPFPCYALDTPAPIKTLMQRRPGESAYQTERANWAGRLASVLVRGFSTMSRMLRLAIEQQAAQVFQTGTINLTDENGKPTFALDFAPKASHFPIAATPWGTTGADPLADITALLGVIRRDGYADIKTLVFGSDAWELFYRNTWVQENLKKDYLGMGALNPELVDKGAGYMGYIFVGAYRLDLYVYDAFYTPWGTTDTTNFLEPKNVLFLPAAAQLDFRRYFGGIPTINVDPVFDTLLGGKIEIAGEYDFRPRVYFDHKREVYVGEIKSRPFMCPVSLDRFGCLKVA